jgi:eukaryotic-like serine/threonine-protein kinase
VSSTGDAARELTQTGIVELELAERKNAVRRFLAMGTVAWTVFIATDFVAARVHGTPLEYLVALRLAGAGIGLTLYLGSGFVRMSTWRLNVFEGSLNPLAALFVSLQALPCGGMESPLSMGVVSVTLIRGLLPAPWSRALPSALGSALVYPVVILVASRVSPAIAAQLDIPIAVWTFTQATLFLVLGACVATAGSHLLWSAREQVDEARKLGSYRLVARIGSGGMGEVWLARQMPLNRRVALKLLKESTLRDPTALRRFKREAEAASSLQHQNTIRVFDFGASDDGVFYIAMELLDGMDLEALVEQLGALPAARVAHLGRQVCGSLAEAHARGIIHCDLKPANLFVTKVGDDYDFAKVLDFGLARLTVGHGHTTVDSIRGTPAFMPPEIIKGEPVTAASDIYAMGAVLYWMVTGTPVFTGKRIHESVIAHLEATPERPSVRLGREVPADLEAVILKCLAKQPDDRYGSARELEAALTACSCGTKWSRDAARASWQELRPSLNKVPATAR